MRLIDSDAEVYGYVETWICDCSGFGRQSVMAVEDISYLPEIDPETLPIVQELRKEMERVTRERDEAVEQLRRDCERRSHYKVTWNGCTPDFECPLSDRCLNRDMWEWVGIQEVQEDEQL